MKTTDQKLHCCWNVIENGKRMILLVGADTYIICNIVCYQLDYIKSLLEEQVFSNTCTIFADQKPQI